MIEHYYTEDWFNTSTDEDRAEFKRWISELLHVGPVKVSFVKKDGTLRDMNCSLKSELVQDYVKKTDKTKETSPDVCPVFDVDKQEWRSFRYDAIRAINGV